MGAVLSVIGVIIVTVASIYNLILLLRIGFDWVQFFAPRWRPRGIILIFANIVYALTDPPLRWLRSFIPPLRLGNVALDVGVLVLFFAVYMVSLAGRLIMMAG